MKQTYQSPANIAAEANVAAQKTQASQGAWEEFARSFRFIG